MWRYWLVDVPARITDVGFAWYRLWLMLTLWLVAVVSLTTVLTVLVTWFGFGVRWGW